MPQDKCPQTCRRLKTAAWQKISKQGETLSLISQFFITTEKEKNIKKQTKSMKRKQQQSHNFSLQLKNKIIKTQTKSIKRKQQQPQQQHSTEHIMKRSISHQRLHRRRQKRQSSSMSFLPIIITILWTILCLTIPFAMVQAQEQSTSPVVGIDLGTTYSCVGIFQNGKVEIIPNEQGNRITPSYVAFSENTIDRMVGDAAKNQATINPTNTVFDVKRLIGRSFSDKSVQADRKLLPFQILSKDNKPVVQVNANGSKNTYSPEEISAMILSNMKTTAEQFLGEPVTRAVISVPAYFNNAQKQATVDAATIAGLKVERIINEPTAAAMAYGIDKTMDDANVLVFDLGGGTFDVTLLNIDGGVFDVLATNGDTHLGGEDFDQRVMQYFIKKIQKTHGTDISNEKVAIQKLRKEVERVKRALSSQTQARIEIDDLIPGLTFTDTLTRARFEELNNDLFKKTMKPIEMVLQDANLDRKDVSHIVLVGGSTRVPRIQELVSEFFGGKELSKGINPDEAVAYGAAIMGGILSGVANQKLDQVVLLDVASLSQGIETVGGIMTKMIERGTTIPTQKTQVFSTNQDNQSSVTIQVYEGERSMTKDNHLLGQFQLSGIPPAPRGVPQIEVSFQIDANGILQVAAVDKATGKSEKVTITADQGRLSQEEIDRMIEVAKEHEEEDRLVKERIDARNGLESYLYNIRNTLEDTGDDGGGLSSNITSKDKKELLDLVDDALDWMVDNPDSDKETYVDKLKEMEQIANPIIRKAYDSSSGGADDMDDYADDEL